MKKGNVATPNETKLSAGLGALVTLGCCAYVARRRLLVVLVDLEYAIRVLALKSRYFFGVLNLHLRYFFTKCLLYCRITKIVLGLDYRYDTANRLRECYAEYPGQRSLLYPDDPRRPQNAKRKGSDKGNEKGVTDNLFQCCHGSAINNALAPNK